MRRFTQLSLWSKLPEWFHPVERSVRGSVAAPVAPIAEPARPAVPTAVGRRADNPLYAPASPKTELPEALKGPMPMRDRYALVERTMLARYGVRVRKWRSNSSGVAWSVQYQDGSTSRLIESPRPRGPMSAAIFLHEIGHHAIGLGRFKPRCLEEYYAWAFSLHTLREVGLPVTERVMQRAGESLLYAVDKAVRRGLKRVPTELMEVARAARARDHGRVGYLLLSSGKRLCEPTEAA